MPSETTELLETLNADILKGLAHQVGLSGASRKPELIAALDQLIHGNVQRILDRLSGTEKKLLAEAVYGDGRLDTARFAAKYGVACPLPRGDVYPASKASPLLLLIGGGYGERRVPASLQAALRAVLKQPPAPAVTPTDSLPDVYQPPESWRKKASRPVHVHESEGTVFPELRSLLKLVQAGKLKVADKSRRPTGDAVRLINDALVVPDFSLEPPAEEITQYTELAGPVRAHAWGVLVQQCGWAKARGGKLGLTTAGQKLLGSCDLKEFASGVLEMLNDGEFDEFNRINHIRGQSGRRGGRYLTSPDERRIPISDSIAQWPVNRWIAFEEAARFAAAAGHQFDVTDEDYTLYFAEFQYGMLSNQSAGINRQYLRAFLFESLATLGLIDVAYVYPHDLWPELGGSWGTDELSFCSRYDGLLYVRLNALGAYCLDVTKSYERPLPQTAGAFRVLPNREVALVDNQQPSAADRHVLELFATQSSDFVWELDAGRILTHLESGGTIEDVLQFLESNSSSPIPETVQVMLADLARGAGAVEGVEDALLVQFNDDTTAALIAHNTQAAKYCYLAGEKRLAVPKKNVRALRTALKKLGFVIPDGRIPN